MDQAAFERFRTSTWQTPFHQHLGLEVIEASDDHLTAAIEMKPELRGRHQREIIHGGVAASMMDSACGYLAALVLRTKLAELPEEEKWARIGRLLTLDMHLDYIRPLISSRFVVTARVLHVGSSIVRLRAELVDADERLLAAASINFAY
jgi:uncharacterized protein (TIGR00369 family)